MPSRPPRANAITPPAGDLHVAFLRGVNVGGKRVSMAELREVATGLGYGTPATLLNSGNLVYRSPGLSTTDAAAQLHAAIAQRTGVRCTVHVRTRQELADILSTCPLPGEALQDGAKLLVTLWDERVTTAMRDAFVAAPWTVERCAAGPHALYLWLPDGISASVNYEQAARALGDRITARNWNTMQKLLALLDSLPAS